MRKHSSTRAGLKIKKALIKFDVIGPEIKLYNMKKTGLRNQTAFGGIMSIVVAVLSVISSAYFFSDIIFKTNPKAYQVTQFKDDVPKLKFDQTGMFFGIQYTNPQNPSLNLYDPKAVTFYGKTQTFKSGRILANYTLERCVYKEDFAGVQDSFPASSFEAEINNTYLCEIGRAHV